MNRLEIVRRLWDASHRGDTDAVFEFYDPNIVWDSGGSGPLGEGGLYEGHEGVRQFFRDWVESFEDYEARAEDFSEEGEKVIVRFRVTGRGRGSGVETDMRRWNVYEFRSGLIVRIQIFETEAEALAGARSG